MSKAFASSLDTKNFAIIDGYAKAVSVLSRSHTPLCSISGGSDSDIVLDVIQNVDEKKKVRYFWIDTGLEYLPQRSISTIWKRSMVSKSNVSRLASRFQSVVRNTVSRFSPNTSANRSCGYRCMGFSGRTSHCRNCWRNTRTARSPCNGGAMPITPRKMESSK